MKKFEKSWVVDFEKGYLENLRGEVWIFSVEKLPLDLKYMIQEKNLRKSEIWKKSKVAQNQILPLKTRPTFNRVESLTLVEKR